jgi:hypothetical protein
MLQIFFVSFPIVVNERYTRFMGIRGYDQDHPTSMRGGVFGVVSGIDRLSQWSQPRENDSRRLFCLLVAGASQRLGWLLKGKSPPRPAAVERSSSRRLGEREKKF